MIEVREITKSVFLYYKNKTRGDIFEENVIGKQLCENKKSKNDPTESNTINQSSKTNDIEITKILSTSQHKSKTIDC